MKPIKPLIIDFNASGSGCPICSANVTLYRYRYTEKYLNASKVWCKRERTKALCQNCIERMVEESKLFHKLFARPKGVDYSVKNSRKFLLIALVLIFAPLILSIVLHYAIIRHHDWYQFIENPSAAGTPCDFETEENCEVAQLKGYRESGTLSL